MVVAHTQTHAVHTKDVTTMGFLDDKGTKAPQTTYLTWEEEPKIVRPLVKVPAPIWVHTIPSVSKPGPEGKPITIRFYSTQPCTAVRGGGGCSVCATKDPLWHLLAKEDQYSKKTGQPVHFGKRKQFLMPVLDTSIMEVRVMKGGNQQYENMDKWFETQPDNMKDLGRCDWSVWVKKNKQNSRFNKYETTRLDATPFTVTPDLVEASKKVMETAMKELQPLDHDALLALVKGNATEEDLVVNKAAVVAPAAPSFSLAGPGPSFEQNVTQPVPTAPQAPATQAAPAAVPSASALKEFTDWVGKQEVFRGSNMLSQLVPALKEKLGTISYHSCTPEQLADLKQFLAVKFGLSA